MDECLDLTRIVSSNSEAQPLRPKWCLIVDEKTGYKSTSFHATKKGMIEPTCEKLKNWEKHGKPVKTICMDNAGENKMLVKQ